MLEFFTFTPKIICYLRPERSPVPEILGAIWTSFSTSNNPRTPAGNFYLALVPYRTGRTAKAQGALADMGQFIIIRGLPHLYTLSLHYKS